MELPAPPARWSVSPSMGAWVGASVSATLLWRVLGRPCAAWAAAHRCLRSACWSRLERSSIRTFFSWSKCSKRLTFICRTWAAPHKGQARRSLPSVPITAGPKHPTTARAFPVHPHLHSLLRGQQLLFLFSDLEDEAWVALQCLTISRRSGRGRPARPGVRSSLAEARTSGPALTLPMPLGQVFPPRLPHSCLPRNSPPPPLPASPV